MSGERTGFAKSLGHLQDLFPFLLATLPRGGQGGDERSGDGDCESPSGSRLPTGGSLSPVNEPSCGHSALKLPAHQPSSLHPPNQSVTGYQRIHFIREEPEDQNVFLNQPQQSLAQCNGMDVMGSVAPVALMIQDPMTPMGQAGPLSMDTPIRLPTYSNNLKYRILCGNAAETCTSSVSKATGKFCGISPKESQEVKVTQELKNIQVEQMTKLQAKHQAECDLLEDMRTFSQKKAAIEREYAQ
ncbi:hypothetical protein JEQ12_006344, partial [Ovis aries]